MKRWIQIAAHIYPAAWRTRYGTEFQALLESVNPGWRELFDVLTGALQMRLTNGATYLKLGAAFALFGAVAAMTTSFLLPPTYVSTAELQMRPADTEELKRIESEVLSRTSLSGLIQRHDLQLYRKERTNQPLEDVIETMRTHDIKIRVVNPTTLSISFAGQNPTKAQAVVNALLGNFSERFVQKHMGSGHVHLEILKRADLPGDRNRLLIVLTGTAAGLMLGLLAATAREKLRHA